MSTSRSIDAERHGLFGLLLCATIACSAGGATPTSARPITEGSTVRSDPPRPSPVRYDLGELPPELGTIAWPAPPRVRRAIAVGSEQEAARAAAQSGSRIVVRDDIDDLTVTADDIEIVNRARIGHLAIERGHRRIRVTGGRYGAIELAVPAQFVPPPPVWRAEWLVEDVMIDDVDVEAADTAFAIRGRRVAIVRSRAHAQRYSVWCGDTGEFSTEDLVIAGNRFDSAGPESTVRLVGVSGAVVVDNVLANTQKHDFRVHGTSDRVFFARNRLLRTGIMVGSMPGDRIGSVWIVDNTLHHTAPSLFQTDPSRVERLVAHGNHIYSDRWSCFVCDATAPRWSVSDNPVEPYRD
jgi:hypothetical protein